MTYDTTKVMLFHYSCKKPIPGNILGSDRERVTVQLLTKSLSGLTTIGEPLVVLYAADYHYQLKGCFMTGVLEGKNILEVKLDIELKDQQQRYYERLPVSISADIRDDGNKKRYSGIIKDISKNGLLVYSKDMMPSGNNLEINVFLENAMIFLEAAVVRKYQNSYYNCFGLSIREGDILSRSNLEKCLRQTCESYTKRLMEECSVSISFENFEYPNDHKGSNEEQMLIKSAMKLDEILRRSKN